MSNNTHGTGGNRSASEDDQSASSGSNILATPTGTKEIPSIQKQPTTKGRKTQTAVTVKPGTGTLPAPCIALREMSFEGNIIPRSWWQTALLRMPDGKPNLPAIVLLSDVVFFYRPYEEVDEKSGLTIGWKKRFSMDKMWKDYEEWGASFGLTKRQVKDAVAFLKKAGLITVEFRTLWLDGERKPNRPFIEPVIERLRSITYSASEAWRIARSSVSIVEYEEETGEETDDETGEIYPETFEPKTDAVNENKPADVKKSPDVITSGSENGWENLPDVITSHIPDDKTTLIPDVITSHIPNDKTSDISDGKTGDYNTKNNIPRVSPQITPQKNDFTENGKGFSLSPISTAAASSAAITDEKRERENLSTEKQEKPWLKDFLRGSQIGQSKFNFKACAAFAEHQQKSGKPIRDAVSIGAKYLKEAIMDEEIEKWLDAQHAPHEILEAVEQERHSENQVKEFIGRYRRFCPSCYGSGMEVVKDKGARKCECPLLTVDFIKTRLAEENEEADFPAVIGSGEIQPNFETPGDGSRVLQFRQPATKNGEGGNAVPATTATEVVSFPNEGGLPDKARAIYHIALEGKRATMETIESDWRSMFDEPDWQQIKGEIINLMNKSE